MKTKIIVSSSLCFAMALSSCSSLSDGAWTRLQGTGIGALGVGGAAAGVAALASDSEDRAQNAMIAGGIGALVGGIAGYAWGDSVAKEKDQYAKREEYVRAHIKQLDTRVDDAEETNEKLQDQIASLKKTNSRLSKADYNSLRNQVNTNIKTINSDIAAADRAAKSASGDELTKLREKRTELLAQRDAMNANLKALGTLQARR